MRLFVTLLLLLAFLSACAGPADPPNPGDGSAEPGVPADVTPGSADATPGTEGPVTISYAASEMERPLYEALAKKFTAENPNITVVVVPIEDLTNLQFPDGQY